MKRTRLAAVVGSESTSPLEEHIRSIVRDELARARPANDGPQLVTIAAYAAQRSISESTVRAAIREGRLPAERFGRAVRVKSTDEISRAVKVDAAQALRDARAIGLKVAR